MNKVAKNSTRQAEETPKSAKKTKKINAQSELEVEADGTPKSAKKTKKIKAQLELEVEADETPKSAKKTKKIKAQSELEVEMDAEMVKEVAPKRDVVQPTSTKKKRKADISLKQSDERDEQTAEIDNQEQVDQEAFDEPSAKKKKSMNNKKITSSGNETKRKPIKDEEREEDNDEHDLDSDQPEASGEDEGIEEDGGDESDEDSDDDESDAITFYIGNLAKPFTADLKHKLQAFFNKHGVSVHLRGHNVKNMCLQYCHAVLLNEDDKEKMAALDGKIFKGSKLSISKDDTPCKSVDKKRIILFNPNTKLVTESGLKEASGAQDAFFWNTMCVAFLGFDNEEDAKKLVDAGSLTVGGHEMIAQYATARKKKTKKNDEGEKSKGKKKKSKTRTGRTSCFHCKKSGHLQAVCPKKK